MLAEQWTVATEAEGRRRRKHERSRRDLPQPEEPTWVYRKVQICQKMLQNFLDRFVFFEMQENLKYLFFWPNERFFKKKMN